MKTNYLITEYSTDYKDDICELADSTLGIGYISNEIDSFETDTNKQKSILLIDPSNNNLIGFGLYDICNYIDIQQITNNLIPYKYRSCAFGYVKTIAISSDYQGQKLGNFIAGYCIEQLAKQNINKLFTTIWYKPENRSNIKMMEHYNFKVNANIPDYWYKSSIETNFICPKCGNPCHCHCLIMTNFL